MFSKKITMKKGFEVFLVKVSLILLILFCTFAETIGQVTEAPSEAPTESSPPSVVPTDAPSLLPTPADVQTVTNEDVQLFF